MKLFLKSFLILFAIANSFAQEYHPMLNNSSWLIYDQVSCCQPSVEKTIENGVKEKVGSITYIKYNDPFYGIHYGLENTVYLREDVVERKVYKLVNGNEVLLYDFSLENSSSITIKGLNYIATVDYIDVNGGKRKRIKLNSIGSASCGETLSQIWIEGVGSNKHPFYPDFNMEAVCSSGGGINIFTRCSFQNGVHIYGNPDCSSEVKVTKIKQSLKDVEIYPIPFKDYLTLKYNFQTNSDVTIEMFDMSGRLLFKQIESGIEVNKETTINLNVACQQKQMYLIRLTLDNEVIVRRIYNK